MIFGNTTKSALLVSTPDGVVTAIGPVVAPGGTMPILLAKPK